jgi:hypothetical protein
VRDKAWRQRARTLGKVLWEELKVIDLGWAASLIYVGACIVMGVGIAVDVAMASFANAMTLRSTDAARQWVNRITATHVGFPMIGYYLVAYLERLGGFRPLLGVVGFGLVLYLVVQLLKGVDGPDESSSGMGVETSMGWPLVLAVSWDALFSGPSKAAQAVGWTSSQVFASFFLVGLVVWFSATIATKLAVNSGELLRTKDREGGLNSAWAGLALFVQVGVFSYFGFLALFTFTLDWMSSTWLAALAGILSATISSLWHCLRTKNGTS